ncbi:MAG: tetratricopeptide repeat protein [Bacteroidia bacterium]
MKRLVVILILFTYHVRSQNADSILHLANQMEDTAKVNYLGRMFWKYTWTNSSLAATLCEEQLRLAKEANYDYGIATAYAAMGASSDKSGDYSTAVENYVKAISIYEKIKYPLGVAKCNTYLGNSFVFQRNYPGALKFYSQALEQFSALKNAQMEAYSYFNIGLVYYYQGKKDLALKNYVQASEVFEKLNDQRALANAYNDIGLIYLDKDSTTTAVRWFKKAIRADSLLDDKDGLAMAYGNMGFAAIKQKQYEAAEKYIGQSLAICVRYGYKDGIKDSYSALTKLYKTTGNFEKALDNAMLYDQMKDSLFDESRNKQIVEMQTKYETEKKELQIKSLESEKAVQRTISLSIAFALLLTVGLAYFIYRNYRQKQEINRLLEHKNKEITDSIRYALRIQNSLLPRENYISRTLGRLSGKG